MHISLDIANELYPLAAGESFTMALARSLVPEDEAPKDVEIGAESKKVKREMWRSGDQGLAADYEYVMYGKVRLLFSGLILTAAHRETDKWGTMRYTGATGRPRCSL